MRYFHASRPCGAAGVSFGLTGRSRGVLGLRIRAFGWLPASKLGETVSNISLIQPPNSRLWWLCRLYCCCRRRHCRLCRCRLLPEALARRSVEPEGPVLCVASSWCSTQGFVAGARSNGSASDPSEKRLHAIEGRSSGGCAAASSDLWLLVLGAARATLRCVAARERCHRGRSLPAAASASGTPSSTACRRTMGSHSGEAARVRRR